MRHSFSWGCASRFVPIVLIWCLAPGLTGSFAAPPPDRVGHISGWRTFANRAGWSIRYPRGWQVGSCNQCSDPSDPDVFVTLYDPATKTLIMVEHLIDKPNDQTVDHWLN